MLRGRGESVRASCRKWDGVWGSEMCSTVVRGRGGSIRASCLGEEAEKTVKGQRQGENLALCAVPVKVCVCMCMCVHVNACKCKHMNTDA